MKERKEIFRKWCKKLTQKPKELEEEYQRRIIEDKTEHPTLTDDERDEFVLSAMQGFYKRQFMSPAKVFEGTIIGILPKFDMVKNIRKTALDLYAKDPERAITEGYTDNEGIPLYLTPEWRQGKPIPDNDWNRKLILIAFQPEAEEEKLKEPRIYQMSLTGDKADLLPPMFRKITFRAGISKDGSRLYSSGVTEFKDLGEEVPVSTIIEVLKDRFVHLENLRNWFQKHVDSEGRIGFDEFVMTRGSVSRLSLQGTDYSKGVITLTDLNLGFVGEDEAIQSDITCWIPYEIDDRYFNFAEGSKAFVVGRPSLTENNEIHINACGLIGDAKFTIAPQKLDEKGIQPTEEKEESKEEEKW